MLKLKIREVRQKLRHNSSTGGGPPNTPGGPPNTPGGPSIVTPSSVNSPAPSGGMDCGYFLNFIL